MMILNAWSIFLPNCSMADLFERNIFSERNTVDDLGVSDWSKDTCKVKKLKMTGSLS